MAGHGMNFAPSGGGGKIDRRTFLVASGAAAAGFAGMRFGAAMPDAAAADFPVEKRARPAKSTILFFLCGGASHVDTWDIKPEASSDYRSVFEPIRTSASGIQLCEHLPMTAKVAHHMAVVHGVSDGGRATGDHHAGYYYNLTGHAPDQTFRLEGNDRRPYPDDWPFMGSVVFRDRGEHPTLPGLISLPHMPSRKPYTRPGQFAGKLGMDFDPFYLQGNQLEPLKFNAPSLTMKQEVGRARLDDREALLGSLNAARAELDHASDAQNYTRQQERAFSLLSSAETAAAFDLSNEPKAVRERYGETINGMSLLMARRLVEAEVPFITVFWKGDRAKLGPKCRSAGSWDTHGNNFNCLADDLLPEFDRGYSALIEDLAQRGLLEDTLVLVNSEMGRKPLIGDRRSGGVEGAGRDHWTACQSVLFAGGGIQGGQVLGETDKNGEYPKDRPIDPADVTRTVYHAMGVTDLKATDRGGRPFNLIDEGRPLTELFG